MVDMVVVGEVVVVVVEAEVVGEVVSTMTMAVMMVQ
jgi:hypothetical protein